METAYFAGIDWATEEHQVCVVDGNGTVVGEWKVRHSGEGLEELCQKFNEIAGNDEVWISIEIPHGAVVETLLERGFTVFAINPKQLDRFRDRFTVAGAKDDRLDAFVLADSLRTDTGCFRRLRIAQPALIELREWSRTAEELKHERVRLCNRFREQLRRYFPAMLELATDVGEEWFLDVWERVPTPAKARRVTAEALERILKRRRIRRWTAAAIREVLRQKPLHVAAGTQEAACGHIAMLIARIRLVNQQIAECLRRIDGTISRIGEQQDGEPQGQDCEQRDVGILASMPGVGRIILATLLAEAWQALAARDYDTLRTLCGVAPVTRRSGKRCVVVMRQACHPRLREAVYHWARVATQYEPRSHVRYQELRARGHSHGRSLRTVADRLLYVVCAMLRRGETFDEDKAIATLPQVA